MRSECKALKKGKVIKAPGEIFYVGRSKGFGCWRGELGGEHKNLGITLLPLSHLLPMLPIDQTQPETKRQDGAASLGTE